MNGKTGETLFLRCSVWRESAENVTETLTKGTRVIAQGRLKSRSFETKEGEKRTVMELDADEVGPSLRYASASITRRPSTSGAGQTNRANQGNQGNQGGTTPPGQEHDPWAAPANTGTNDGWGPDPAESSEPPF